MSGTGPFQRFRRELHELIAKGVGIPGCTFPEDFQFTNSGPYKNILKPEKLVLADEVHRRNKKLNRRQSVNPPRTGMSYPQAMHTLKNITALPDDEIEEVRAKIAVVQRTVVAQPKRSAMDAWDALWNALEEEATAAAATAAAAEEEEERRDQQQNVAADASKPQGKPKEDDSSVTTFPEGSMKSSNTGNGGQNNTSHQEDNMVIDPLIDNPIHPVDDNVVVVVDHNNTSIGASSFSAHTPPTETSSHTNNSSTASLRLIYEGYLNIIPDEATKLSTVCAMMIGLEPSMDPNIDSFILAHVGVLDLVNESLRRNLQWQGQDFSVWFNVLKNNPVHEFACREFITTEFLKLLFATQNLGGTRNNNNNDDDDDDDSDSQNGGGGGQSGDENDNNSSHFESFFGESGHSDCDDDDFLPDCDGSHHGNNGAWGTMQYQAKAGGVPTGLLSLFTSVHGTKARTQVQGKHRATDQTFFDPPPVRESSKSMTYRLSDNTAVLSDTDSVLSHVSVLEPKDSRRSAPSTRQSEPHGYALLEQSMTMMAPQINGVRPRLVPWRSADPPGRSAQDTEFISAVGKDRFGKEVVPHNVSGAHAMAPQPRLLVHASKQDRQMMEPRQLPERTSKMANPDIRSRDPECSPILPQLEENHVIENNRVSGAEQQRRSPLQRRSQAEAPIVSKDPAPDRPTTDFESTFQQHESAETEARERRSGSLEVQSFTSFDAPNSCSSLLADFQIDAESLSGRQYSRTALETVSETMPETKESTQEELPPVISTLPHGDNNNGEQMLPGAVWVDGFGSTRSISSIETSAVGGMSRRLVPPSRAYSFCPSFYSDAVPENSVVTPVIGPTRQHSELNPSTLSVAPSQPGLVREETKKKKKRRKWGLGRGLRSLARRFSCSRPGEHVHEYDEQHQPDRRTQEWQLTGMQHNLSSDASDLAVAMPIVLP